MSVSFRILWKITDSLSDSLSERYEQVNIIRKLEKFFLPSGGLNKTQSITLHSFVILCIPVHPVLLKMSFEKQSNEPSIPGAIVFTKFLVRICPDYASVPLPRTNQIGGKIGHHGAARVCRECFLLVTLPRFTTYSPFPSLPPAPAAKNVKKLATYVHILN